MHKLRRCDFNRPISQRMTFETVPWMTRLSFDGHPVKRFLSPEVSGDGTYLESVFDAWCYPWVEGEPRWQAQGEALIEAGEEHLLRFITANSTTPAEAAVMLLYALSQAEGAELFYNKDTITVTAGQTHFGIVNGAIKSRFCTGLELGDVNPKAVLEKTRTVRVFDPVFIALYREAYKQGDGAVEMLCALKSDDVKFSFIKYFKIKGVRKPISSALLMRVENALMQASDPVGRAYSILVPLCMGAKDFRSVFGLLSTRSLDVSIEKRQQLVNKINDFSHNKKKKESK